MTQVNTLAASGMLVPAKPLPDLQYPHWKKWYNTKSWLSNLGTQYTPFQVEAGQHIHAANSFQRNWHVDTPPTRGVLNYTVTEEGMDLTTPCYMLAGTETSNTLGDTLIGLDYFNPPLQMAKDIFSLADQRLMAVSTNQSMWCRVLAINHTFTVVNYSRFPLEMYYAVLPIGTQYEDLEVTTVPHRDLGNSQYRKIVIRGVRDAGDRGAKKDIKISANLQQIFPHQYDMPPGIHGGDTLAEFGGSPWFGVLPTQTASIMTSVPPGQTVRGDQFETASAKQEQVPALTCRFYGKLQFPMNIGTTTFTAAPTGGDTDSNSYTIHSDMSWLVEYMNVNSIATVHPGEKAYPDQVA